MAALPEPYRSAHAFAFGDAPELADSLLALVLAGTKTATCGAPRDIGPDAPMPQVGRRDVVLDGQGRPACAMETLSVEIVPFNAVSRDFAEAEGEGSYEEWRLGHIAFFQRNGGWTQTMELVCERFRLVDVFARETETDSQTASRTNG